MHPHNSEEHQGSARGKKLRLYYNAQCMPLVSKASVMIGFVGKAKKLWQKKLQGPRERLKMRQEVARSNFLGREKEMMMIMMTIA